MINARLYRAALVPFVIALAIAAFSLGARPLPLTSTLAPEAFEGTRALSQLQSLAARFPERRAGSSGDQALAAEVQHLLEGLGGTAGGGFSVHVRHLEGQTVDGERPLTTVIAQRPGSTDATPVLIVAHRDAAARGSVAELSGTAVLLELARVFATRETKRTIILASTSGGSGGDAGAAELARALPSPLDAAIVIGDVAGARVRKPMVVPFSDGLGSAPLQLQRTVSDAITQETGVDPGAPSALGQLAHLAFPMAAGEQGVLEAAGVPSVLVQASGEVGPSPTEPVSVERIEGLGRAVLGSVDALDGAPDISSAPQTGLVLARKTLPPWALRLLIGTLLLAPLIAVADGLARARRRRMPAGRWVLWTLTCALPFLCCAVFAYLLGVLGVVGAPTAPVPASAMGLDATAAGVLAAVILTFLLAWLLWGMLLRRLRWGMLPDPDVAGLSVLLVLVPVAVVVWVGNPFAALLLLPAVHLWLLLASPELRPRRLGALALVAAGLLPLALLILFYSHQLGLGLGAAAWMAVLLLAGGHVGLLGAILWSVALGCAAAAGMVALGWREPAPAPVADGRPLRITIRGPMSYAGPGSLGGTESALRR